jgi:uncharacterized iron-regulated protein
MKQGKLIQSPGKHPIKFVLLPKFTRAQQETAAKKKCKLLWGSLSEKQYKTFFKINKTKLFSVLQANTPFASKQDIRQKKIKINNTLITNQHLALSSFDSIKQVQNNQSRIFYNNLLTVTTPCTILATDMQLFRTARTSKRLKTFK